MKFTLLLFSSYAPGRNSNKLNPLIMNKARAVRIGTIAFSLCESRFSQSNRYLEIKNNMTSNLCSEYDFSLHLRQISILIGRLNVITRNIPRKSTYIKILKKSSIEFPYKISCIRVWNILLYVFSSPQHFDPIIWPYTSCESLSCLV